MPNDLPDWTDSVPASLLSAGLEVTNLAVGGSSLLVASTPNQDIRLFSAWIAFNPHTPATTGIYVVDLEGAISGRLFFSVKLLWQTSVGSAFAFGSITLPGLRVAANDDINVVNRAFGGGAGPVDVDVGVTYVQT